MEKIIHKHVYWMVLDVMKKVFCPRLHDGAGVRVGEAADYPLDLRGRVLDWLPFVST